ncbi:unnamed protein product, partial [Linum tenue]
MLTCCWTFAFGHFLTPSLTPFCHFPLCRLKVRDKAVLTGVFAKYGLQAAVATKRCGGGAVVREDLFRNSIATREVYSLEGEVRVSEECRAGD